MAMSSLVSSYIHETETIPRTRRRTTHARQIVLIQVTVWGTHECGDGVEILCYYISAPEQDSKSHRYCCYIFFEKTIGDEHDRAGVF